jgi:hypothetical protein
MKPILPLLFGAAFLMASCSDETECTVNEDCPAHSECRDGQCGFDSCPTEFADCVCDDGSRGEQRCNQGSWTECSNCAGDVDDTDIEPSDVETNPTDDVEADTDDVNDAETDVGPDAETDAEIDVEPDVEADVEDVEADVEDVEADAEDVEADVETDPDVNDSGLAAGCTESGGTVTSTLCCDAAGPFPDLCSVGACGCAPASSADTQTCDCGAGRCFDGNACVAE